MICTISAEIAYIFSPRCVCTLLYIRTILVRWSVVCNLYICIIYIVPKMYKMRWAITTYNICFILLFFLFFCLTPSSQSFCERPTKMHQEYSQRLPSPKQQQISWTREKIKITKKKKNKTARKKDRMKNQAEKYCERANAIANYGDRASESERGWNL